MPGTFSNRHNRGLSMSPGFIPNFLACLLPKRVNVSVLVMLFLVLNVGDNFWDMGGSHCCSEIAFLPSESFSVQGHIVQHSGSDALHLLHQRWKIYFFRRIGREDERDPASH